MQKHVESQVNLKSVSHLYPKISPLLLRIQASLCKILHASESGEVIHKILKDWERCSILAEDGRDAELLSARLSLIHVHWIIKIIKIHILVKYDSSSSDPLNIHTCVNSWDRINDYGTYGLGAAVI